MTSSPPSPATEGSALALLERLTEVIESRLPARGGDPAKSYVARLLARGPDAFLKKIGEEATELVMACKDAQASLASDGARAALTAQVASAAPASGSCGAQSAAPPIAGSGERIVSEAADLWFHTLVALAYFGLSARDVAAELARREGLSGLAEKARRPRP